MSIVLFIFNRLLQQLIYLFIFIETIDKTICFDNYRKTKNNMQNKIIIILKSQAD